VPVRLCYVRVNFLSTKIDDLTDSTGFEEFPKNDGDLNAATMKTVYASSPDNFFNSDVIAVWRKSIVLRWMDR
jgi:hypothetical protein